MGNKRIDKLGEKEFIDVLEDVRKAYRLLALYQRRLLDLVNHIGNVLEMNINSGWYKFSKEGRNGTKLKLKSSSWDWLNLYLYSFLFDEKPFDGQNYKFRIIHQADTGFYDSNLDPNLKDHSENFFDVSKSKSQLLFVLHKEGVTREELNKELKNYYSIEPKNEEISEAIAEKCLVVCYGLERFINESSTKKVLDEFNYECYEKFGIQLLK